MVTLKGAGTKVNTHQYPMTLDAGLLFATVTVRLLHEIHCLMQCEKMKTDRDIIFSEIEKQCPNFRMLSKQDKFIYLLSAGGTMVSIVAQLVHKHLP